MPRGSKGRGKNRTYVRFDEREDVIASMELLTLLIPLANKTPRYWKWIIIAAQSAVQGALVCALSGTAGIGALTKDLQSAWLAWFDTRKGPVPDEKLADFKTLLKWARDPKILSPPLKLTTSQIRDLLKLHTHLRNNFTHFTPKGWSIEIAGLPRMVLAAIQTAEWLMLNQTQISIHLSGNQKRSISRATIAAHTSFDPKA